MWPDFDSYLDKKVRGGSAKLPFGIVQKAEDVVIYDGKVVNSYPVTLTEPLVVGDTYVLVYDGTEYEQVAQTNGEQCALVCGYGNVLVDEGATSGVWYGAATSHTPMKIVHHVPEVVKTIDPKFIKDMYYEESTPEKVLLDGSCSISSSGGTATVGVLSEPLVAGESYVVTIDGTDVAMESASTAGAALSGVGNAFFDTALTTCSFNGASGTHTVKIVKPAVVEVKTIDPKYLPSARYVVPMTWSDDGTATLDPSVTAFDLIAKIKAGVKVVMEVPQKEAASGGYVVLKYEIPVNAVMEHEEFETGTILDDYCAVLFGFMETTIYHIYSNESYTELRQGALA